MADQEQNNTLSSYELELEKVVDSIREAETSLIGIMILNEYVNCILNDED